MPLAPGTRLGPYEIAAPLGAGGMGEVYRARDGRLGRDVAVKVLPEAVASHPDRLARFEREARSVAALNHPNVVTLYAIEEAGGVRFLAMELVEGQTLDRLLAPGGLPLTRVLDLAVPLADALSAAHQRGVVHRDLKPANVMVTREGRVKVLDFGLAKSQAEDTVSSVSQAATAMSPLSSAGLVVGTVPYMAPEQVRGEAADARTDLFAFGVLLYELLTGQRPFRGATPADVSSAILRDQPDPMHATRPDLPAEFERVVTRCLEKDRDQRFASAKDVRDELELVRRGIATGAVVSSRPARPPAASRELPSIAVLPFANRSSDPDDEYFAEGLADELLSVLARIRGLRVAARTSSAQFKGTSEDVATIGRKLNVATLLEGSVRKSGARVRISVQLVKVADGYHLWSESFDRTLDDIFAVQDDIAQSVVKELRTSLLGEVADSKASGEAQAEVAAAAVGRGTHAEAHRLYLQGRHFTSRLGGKEVDRGLTLLRQAVALEPDHALAWAALAWAETLAATLTGEGSGDIERARSAAAHSLELQPDLPEGLFAMGSIQLWHDFDWSAADAAFRRALESRPGDAEMLRANALMSHIMGRHDEALSLCLQAVQQDPLSVSSYTYLARAHAARGRFAESEAAYRKAIELSPEAMLTRCLLALVLVDLGRLEEALETALAEPAPWARQFALAVVHFASGHQEDSDRALEHLTRTMSSYAAYQIACVHAIRREKDEAFHWLDRAYRQRDAGLVMVRTHHQLAALHEDARWLPLLEKLRLPA
jgi:serine/threonine protein kinase/tetratricopeptide (TPR) repeat protein